MEESSIAETKNKKKSFYKKWWFWVIAVFVLFGIGSMSSEPESSNVIDDTEETNQVTETSQPAATTPTPKSTANQNGAPAPTTTPTPSVTVSQKNAVQSAKSYLSFSSGFSYAGLVSQLEYEKFSHDDAVYGVDHSGANWNEQATKAAKAYMEFSSFSRGSLIEQLKHDKFTQAQSEYGASSVGL